MGTPERICDFTLHQPVSRVFLVQMVMLCATTSPKVRPWICVAPGESGHRVQYVAALCGVIPVDADLIYYDNAFVILAMYFPISSLQPVALTRYFLYTPPNRPRRSAGDISRQLT